MALSEAFESHLASGLTTLARCWALTRRDGLVLGFTDHDRDIAFEGITFKADTGLSARALQQTTGLAIDNSEALGALSAAAVTEADVRAGRYDGATVRAWLVNWQEPALRTLQFRGHLGEIARVAGAFRAELLGLTEALNQVQGRVYQVPCAAVLGDSGCKVDLSQALLSGLGVVQAVDDQKVLSLSGLDGFYDRWFERGRLKVLTGAAAGLVGVVKNDRASGTVHQVELWEALRAEVAVGDTVEISAGCDKRVETCRYKFDNLLNYRGFPDIPGEDQLLQVPVAAVNTDQTGGAK